MNRSVKDRVIALATQDPFLTVDELANLAETTTRYVRTILSEANLSLNEMRKNYARQLERRLDSRPEKDLIVQRDLQILKLPADSTEIKVADWAGQELFQIAQHKAEGKTPAYILLITPFALNVQLDYNKLRELLPFPQSELVVGEQRLEVLPAPSELKSLSHWSGIEQVLKLSVFLLHRRKIVAVEVKWLAVDGLVLALEPTDNELKVVGGE